MSTSMALSTTPTVLFALATVHLSFILSSVSASLLPTIAGFIILIYSEHRNYLLYLDLHAAMLFVAAKDRDTIVSSEQ